MRRPQPRSTLFPYTTLFRSGKALIADLHDEKTNKRLLTKGTELTREMIEKISTRNLKRLRLNEKDRSEEHTSELQSRGHLVCRLLLEKKKNTHLTCQHLHDI